ncbi:MAG TPA: hypothetical protein VFO07_04830 [Roseiflexaceae bacterium]|nr:hypothetical protein [Roseiflexaceae bacterium]
MPPQPHYLRIALMSALSAGLCLVGSLVLPFLVALVVGQLMGNAANPPRAVVVMLIVLALVSLAGGSAAWGIALARLTGAPNSRRLALACALSYGPATLAGAFLLGRIEPIVVEGTPGLPIHMLFTLLFVPVVFLVAAATGLAIGWALRSGRLAATAALGGGAAAALGFFAVDVLLDSLGMRVGAPRAEESATMIKVLAIGDLGAALAGGAVIGVILARHIAARQSNLGAQSPALQTSSPQ